MRLSSISATARIFTEPRPCPVGVEHPGAAEDERAGREVGALHEAHQLVRRRLGVLEHVQGGVDDLAEVVGRDVRRHADGDALGAVDEQVREAGRQDDGLHLVAVVVRDEVDGPLVDAVQQRQRQRREPALGVAHCRRPACRGPERRSSPCPSIERVAKAEVLRHPGQGVVDRHVAMGVEPAHDVADDLGALHVRPVGPEALCPHIP